MDKDCEDELLLHVAAGTDLPTAFAALPRDSDAHDDSPARPQVKTIDRLVWTILIFVAMIAYWWLMS